MELVAHYGELAALITAVFWTITALSFESASKQIGSLHLNLLRLGLALILLTAFSWIRRDMPLPMDAGTHQWTWLSISGIIGFVIGDFCLFQAFIMIGARVAMLLMTLAPPMAALTGWYFYGDAIDFKGMLGMMVTILGIALVIFVRTPSSGLDQGKAGRVKLAHPLKGIILALVAAMGQGIGLVLSKHGMQSYDPFSSSQIRVFAGFLGFALIFAILGKFRELPTSIRNKKAMIWLSVGSFFGPFLGVSFSMIAVQHTNAGIAQTIMSLVPVMIIPPSIIFGKEKPKFREILGAIIAVAGVSLFFL
ncbi:MAG: DMT family transporter [Bacteroidetes bacterium]|nr:DMT family transporter [Bacteroidota bacterium]